MVLNRGTVEHLGAVKSSRGIENFWTLHVFTYELHLGVPPNREKTKKGCRESKKVEILIVLN